MRKLTHLSSLVIPASPHTWRQRLFGTGPYWAYQLSLWVLVVTGSDLGLILLYGDAVSVFTILSALVFALDLIVGTHLSRMLILGARRRPRSAGFLALIALSSIPVCAAAAAVISTVIGYLFFNAESAPFSAFVSFRVAYMASIYGACWLATYCGWSFLQAFHDAETARLRADTAAKEAELLAIKAQLNPHFLFNSLNTLRALIPRDQHAPREAITMLADLLRAALTVQTRATIPLQQELETVDAYLALEQMRFEERLRIRRAINPACLACPVPPFALQTLVENAVKFGIAPRPEGGEIALVAEPVAGALRFCITNPGRIAATASASTGFGLRSVRQRIRHLFGPHARLDLLQTSDDLVTAELLLPPPAP